MYIQITTRCNMSCAHCCFACTENGEDMSFNIFKKAIDFYSGYVSIGGGEPTLHKHFNKFLLYALGHCEGVWLATNGSNTETSIVLAGMASRGILGVALSLDDFHDPIDQEVIDAFQIDGKRQSNDFREIRDVSTSVSNAGRARSRKNQYNYGFIADNKCCCTELFVDPKGYVHGCGCKNAPIFGNFLKGNVVIPETWEYGECYKNQPKN